MLHPGSHVGARAQSQGAGHPFGEIRDINVGQRHNRCDYLSVSRAVWPETREGVDRMDWRHRALCRDEDPELFFPIGTTGPAERQVDEAKAVCRRCAVTSDCLTWALETGQDAGVWGGLSEDERRALKRQQVRQRVRTA